MNELFLTAASNSERAGWALALAGPPVAIVLCLLVAARMWRSQERRILAAGCILAFLLLGAEIVFLAATGGDDASLTVRNGTPWQVEIAAPNIGHNVVPAYDSREFRIYGGPGWIEGLIDNVEVLGGPTASTHVNIHGLQAGEDFEIVVTEGILAAGEQPR